MALTRTLLLSLAAALVAAPVAHAGGNPWRSSGDYYQGPGEAKAAKPKPPQGFGRPGVDSLYPPLSEDETLAPAQPAVPVQREAPVYPPFEGGEPRSQGVAPAPGPQQRQPAHWPPAPTGGAGQGAVQAPAPGTTASPPVVIIYPQPGYGYGYGYGVPGYGVPGFGVGPFGGLDPFSPGGGSTWATPPAVGGPVLWGATPGMW